MLIDEKTNPRQTAREFIRLFVRSEFIGPNLKEDLSLELDEVLHIEPLKRYLSGVLFPKDDSYVGEVAENGLGIDPTSDDDKEEKEENSDDWILCSNAKKQSAMSITASPKSGSAVTIHVKGGYYVPLEEKVQLEGGKTITVTKYKRKNIDWVSNKISLKETRGFACDNLTIYDSEGNRTELEFSVIGLYGSKGSYFYAFCLENKKVKPLKEFADLLSYFQCEFSVTSDLGFNQIDGPAFNGDSPVYDEDYRINELLYRDNKCYSIGHGCAPVWDDSNDVLTIKTEFMPFYEIPSTKPRTCDYGDNLSMSILMDDSRKDEAFGMLESLLNDYRSAIESMKTKAATLDDCYKVTANKQIDECLECADRMEEGISILKNDKNAMKAFQLMNEAMLLQQIHFRLPNREYTGCGEVEDGFTIPDHKDQTTWAGAYYGHWRAFQLAFILINLKSFVDEKSADRGFTELIWFATGGGKTEAYLGLSAFVIFWRKIANKDEYGTAIIMRYTLRLLTSQQYSRASSLICACEYLRSKNETLLGKNRITIGLWVGGKTTPNKNEGSGDDGSAESSYKNLSDKDNPFAILKCPWCGVRMGPDNKHPNDKSGYWFGKLPGAKFKKKRFYFQCSNCDCFYSETALPMEVVDETIYAEPPTMLIGTVDKFATLPFYREASSLFGIKNGKRFSRIDLIIQDEMHLISGPLGSRVGFYENMIEIMSSFDPETKTKGILPKIIASTATVSEAKEQCHNLYAIPKENVKIFPPRGIDANYSFFSELDKSKPGRMYCGIYASGVGSSMENNTRLYAALLTAAATMPTDDDNLKDAYWTNVGYFGNLNTVGQASSLCQSNVKEYKESIDKRYSKWTSFNKRYVRDQVELTSRISGTDVATNLHKLELTKNEGAIDICLATNMISVGLDVPRLGLMTVIGQPKSISEYIQATSRVGRSDALGLVFVVYSANKVRDRSIFEDFQTVHSKLYYYVEPTSVTPFAPRLLERCLPAVLFGTSYLVEEPNASNGGIPTPQDSINNGTFDLIGELTEERSMNVDSDSSDRVQKRNKKIINRVEKFTPVDFATSLSNPDPHHKTLYCAEGQLEIMDKPKPFPVPTSMRDVDSNVALVIKEEEDDLGYE